MTLQRTVQVIGLTLFVGLLVNAGFGFTDGLPHDLFLRLDPSAALVTGVAARFWQGAFIAALAILAVTFILGRFFCGYLCPLGTTIDGADACLSARGPALATAGWRRWKYAVLVFILAAALMGLSLAFVTAPIPLVTRFYALVVFASLQRAADLLLALAAPLTQWFDLPGLRYLQLPLRGLSPGLPHQHAAALRADGRPAGAADPGGHAPDRTLRSHLQ